MICVSIFMFGCELSNYVYINLGIFDGYYVLSYYVNDLDKIDKLVKINVYYM